MNETYVTILGNVVDEPVLRATSSGDPFVTFRLASTPRRRRPGSNEFVNADSNFYDVVAFRQLALHAGSNAAAPIEFTAGTTYARGMERADDSADSDAERRGDAIWLPEPRAW